MSLELCVLASGSSGNASIVRTPHGCILIDAGIGPQTLAARLQGTRCALADVRALVLTHLDSDHLTSTWGRSMRTLRWRIHCHQHARATLVHRLGDEAASLVHTFRSAPFSPLEGLTITPIPLAHDEHGSHGFLLEGFGCRLGYATDLGHVPKTLVDAFAGVDLLCLEANYDVYLQRYSSRPTFLKHRIMGGNGHLSNEQAFDAVQAIIQRHPSLPAHIVLLHRSRQCNCPTKLRTLFQQDERIAPRLVLAEQTTRTSWLSACQPASVGE